MSELQERPGKTEHETYMMAANELEGYSDVNLVFIKDMSEFVKKQIVHEEAHIGHILQGISESLSFFSNPLNKGKLNRVWINTLQEDERAIIKYKYSVNQLSSEVSDLLAQIEEKDYASQKEQIKQKVHTEELIYKEVDEAEKRARAKFIEATKNWKACQQQLANDVKTRQKAASIKKTSERELVLRKKYNKKKMDFLHALSSYNVQNQKFHGQTLPNCIKEYEDFNIKIGKIAQSIYGIFRKFRDNRLHYISSIETQSAPQDVNFDAKSRSIIKKMTAYDISIPDDRVMEDETNMFTNNLVRGDNVSDGHATFKPCSVSKRPGLGDKIGDFLGYRKLSHDVIKVDKTAIGGPSSPVVVSSMSPLSPKHKVTGRSIDSMTKRAAKTTKFPTRQAQLERTMALMASVKETETSSKSEINDLNHGRVDNAKPWVQGEPSGSQHRTDRVDLLSPANFVRRFLNHYDDKAAPIPPIDEAPTKNQMQRLPRAPKPKLSNENSAVDIIACTLEVPAPPAPPLQPRRLPVPPEIPTSAKPSLDTSKIPRLQRWNMSKEKLPSPHAMSPGILSEDMDRTLPIGSSDLGSSDTMLVSESLMGECAHDQSKSIGIQATRTGPIALAHTICDHETRTGGNEREQELVFIEGDLLRIHLSLAPYQLNASGKAMWWAENTRTGEAGYVLKEHAELIDLSDHQSKHAMPSTAQDDNTPSNRLMPVDDACTGDMDAGPVQEASVMPKEDSNKVRIAWNPTIASELIRSCCLRIIHEGLAVEGLLRISGSFKRVKDTFDAYQNTGKIYWSSASNIHDVCGLLKQGLKSYPLFNNSDIPILKQINLCTDEKLQQEGMVDFLKSMDPKDYQSLWILLHTFLEISKRKEVTKMGILNIVKVIPPTLIPCSHDLRLVAGTTDMLLIHYHIFFGKLTNDQIKKELVKSTS